MPNASNITPGLFLNNRYRIERKLGAGGMGEVFKALDCNAQTAVAIKRMLDDSPKERKRFAREYQFLQMVDHPNLLTAYDFFENQRELFMVLEYVQGRSLKEILAGGRQIYSLAQQLAIANKVARAVEILNTAGIIHRDIKPANIMIDETNAQVKLLDLGVGKNISSSRHNTILTMEGAAIATLLGALLVRSEE